VDDLQFPSLVLALRLVDEGQSVPHVAVAFGVHKTTIYRRVSVAV
jgi:transposase